MGYSAATAIKHTEMRSEGHPRATNFVTIPSRADGVARALRKSFGPVDNPPNDLGDLGDLIERLKRINA